MQFGLFITPCRTKNELFSQMTTNTAQQEANKDLKEPILFPSDNTFGNVNIPKLACSIPRQCYNPG